jgi:hypothetical protein
MKSDVFLLSKRYYKPEDNIQNFVHRNLLVITVKCTISLLFQLLISKANNLHKRIKNILNYIKTEYALIDIVSYGNT